MKIKSKKQFWRRWGRLLLDDFVVVVGLLVFLNVPCGIYRVGDDAMSPALNDGDLVMILKVKEAATDDVVLFCDDESMLGKIIASDDELELRDDKLFINQEEIMEVDDADVAEIRSWQIEGGYLLKNGNNLIATKEIVGKIILNIRVRNF